MTSQDNQVQAIIQEIDTLLSQASPRLPWVASHETSQQRQLLERTRQYLVDLQRSQGTSAALPNASSSQLGLAEVPAETAQQVLQAVLQEVEYLRTNVMQPMRSQIDDLQRQRQRLMGEIEQVAPSIVSAVPETSAGAISPARSASEQSIAEFLEALISEMQQSLSAQLQHAVSQIQPQLTSAATPLLSASASASEPETAALAPEQRLAKLQQLQQRIDQLMQELDVTLTTLSASLQQNVESYQTSLAEGLDTVQSLGASGEPLINVLVSHLAQQLGRETSAYLQSALPWQPTAADLADSENLDAIATLLTSDEPTGDFLGTEPRVDLNVSGSAIAAADADTPVVPLETTASTTADQSSSLDADIVIAESVQARALEFLNSLESNDLQFDALTHQALVMPVPPESAALEDTGKASQATSLDLASLDLELPSLEDVSPVNTEVNEVDETDTNTSLTASPAVAPSDAISEEIEAISEAGADAEMGEANPISPEAVEFAEETESTDPFDQLESFIGTDTAPQIQQALGEFYASLLGQNNAPSLEEAVSATDYEATEMLLNQVDLDTDLEQAIDDALQQAELSALEYAQQADVAVQNTAEEPAAPSVEHVEPIENADLEQAQPSSESRPVEPVAEPSQTDQIDQINQVDQINQIDQVDQVAEVEPVTDQIAEQTSESDAVFDWADDADAGVTAETAPISEETIEEIVRDESAVAPVAEGDGISAIADESVDLIPTDTKLSSFTPNQPSSDQSPASASYIEDLLAEPVAKPSVQPLDFILDDDTLQQLSADLSELEGIENLEDVDPDAASLANFSADFDVSDDARRRETDDTAQTRDSSTRPHVFESSAEAEAEADDTLAEFTADFDDSPFTDAESTPAARESEPSDMGDNVTLDRFWADFPTSDADTPMPVEDESARLEDFAADLDDTNVIPSGSAPSEPEPTESTETMEVIIDRLFFNLNQAEQESENINVDINVDDTDSGVTLDEFGQAIGSKADAADAARIDADDADTDSAVSSVTSPSATASEKIDDEGDAENESLTDQVLDRLFQDSASPKSETDTQTLTIDGVFGDFAIPDAPAVSSTPTNQANASDSATDPTEDTRADDAANDADRATDQPVDATEDDPTDLFNGLGTEQSGHHRLDELDQHESLGKIEPLDWQSNSDEELAGDVVTDLTADLLDSSLLDNDLSTDAIAPVLKTDIKPVTPIDHPEAVANEAATALMTLDEPELEPATPKPLTLDPQAQDQEWYLGLDIGATGISAVLLNRQTQAQHPLFWTTTETHLAERPQRYFRLPNTVQYTAPSHQTANHPDLQPVGLCFDLAGLSASSIQSAIAPVDSAPSAQSAVKLHRLKPFLKYGVPYLSPAEPEQGEAVLTLEPSVRWSAEQTLPLAHLQQGLQVLLETLTVQSAEAPLCCSAVDLSQHTLYTVLRVLSGVIVSYPTNWPDTYSFNIREAILEAQLVEDPAEIFFVDNAIAALLSALPHPNTAHQLDVGVIQAHPQTVQSGNTLVLSAGALTSEFGLVELPDPLSELNFDAFDLRSIAYGGDALDQDIVRYLLYPQAMQQIQPDQPLLPALTPTRQVSSSADAEGSDSGNAELSTMTSDWDFQLTYDGDLVSAWQALELDQLALPRQGEPDLQHREQLRQRLQSSRLGQSLLQAAQHLKILLQQQAQMTIAINNIRWVIERQDFERQILLPYVQLLNRHLNTLFSKSGIATEGIRQAICTGGTASFPAIARWLRQKLPNATVIQDTYAANRPPSCSRIAYGLVNLVYYPQALDIARQQYNDYFLLLEILRSFPQQPLTIHQMMQQLERFGINTQACYFHIMALLEGHLPPGLVPAMSAHSPLQTHAAAQARHKALLVQPLFHKGKGQQYIPNPAQRERLQQYLDLLLAEKHQALTEPLITQLLMD